MSFEATAGSFVMFARPVLPEESPHEIPTVRSPPTRRESHRGRLPSRYYVYVHVDEATKIISMKIGVQSPSPIKWKLTRDRNG
jgi:hypothetical protein